LSNVKKGYNIEATPESKSRFPDTIFGCSSQVECYSGRHFPC